MIIHFQITVLEFARVIVAVAHIEPFPVLRVALFAWEITERRSILIAERIGLVQPPGRVNLSGQDIQHGACACLSVQVSVENALQAVVPWHLDGRSRTQDPDDILVHSGHGFQKRDLILGDAHMGPVDPLRFTQLIQPEAIQNDIRRPGKIHCLFRQHRIFFPCPDIAL